MVYLITFCQGWVFNYTNTNRIRLGDIIALIDVYFECAWRANVEAAWENVLDAERLSKFQMLGSWVELGTSWCLGGFSKSYVEAVSFRMQVFGDDPQLNRPLFCIWFYLYKICSICIHIWYIYIYISSCHWTLNILGFTISSPPPAQKKRIQEEGIFTKRVGDQQMDCCMSTSQWSFRCFLVGHTNLGPEKGRYHCGGERGSATGGNPFRNFAKYAKNIILFQEFGGWHMLIHYQGCYNIYLHRGPAPRNPSKSLTSIKSIGIWHNATGVDWPFSHHKSGPLGPLGDELSFCFQVSGSFCTQPFCVGGTMIMGLRHFLLSNNQETKCYTPED